MCPPVQMQLLLYKDMKNLYNENNFPNPIERLTHISESALL